MNPSQETASTMASFLFDRGRRVLVVRVGATYSSEALLYIASGIKAFIAREGVCPIVVDWTDSTDITVGAQTLIERARQGALMKGQTRIIVAPSDVMFGLGRLYQSYQEEPLTVVRTMDEAYAVLGVTQLSLEPFVLAAQPAIR